MQSWGRVIHSFKDIYMSFGYFVQHLALTLSTVGILYNQKPSLKFFDTKPTIWTPLDSSGPQETIWDILSWLGTLRTPRVCRGHFVLFVPNPHNMGVYRLPWTSAVKFWHFELTQDHLGTEDTEGDRRSLCPFCSKPLQYGCLWTPLDPHIQDLTFWADSGPPGHWGHRGCAGLP